jgi:hypothetical protein
MRYEVVESPEGWVVRREGVEVARFALQGAAFDEVTRRIEGEGQYSGRVSLALHFQRRAG